MTNNNTTNNVHNNEVKRPITVCDNEVAEATTREAKRQIAMQIAAEVEEASTSSVGFIRSMSAEAIMELESYFKPAKCECAMNKFRSYDGFTGKQTILMLAYLLMKQIYLTDCEIEGMILSGSECALKRAYGIIRKRCAEYVINFFSSVGSTRRKIAHVKNDNYITIQVLTGTVRVWSNGHATYKHGCILGNDGLALDPSHNCWDILMFLVYTD